MAQGIGRAGTPNLIIDGLDEWRAAFKRYPRMTHDAASSAMRQSVIVVQREVTVRAPHDRGGLRSSIATKVFSMFTQVIGIVGTVLFYAPYLEFGTGTQSDGPGGSGKRHWPPGDALNTWAKRHGFDSGAQVARIIGMRGGIKPRRYFRRGFKAAEAEVMRHFEACLDAVMKTMSRGR
jgi:hypothetical protein